MVTQASGLHWIEIALAAMPALRVSVFGDFCLDAYWHVDAGDAELSVETGLPIRRIRSQQYAPGAAGNVVANLLDMGIATVRAVGIVGSDLFGSELLRLLQTRGADVGGMLVSPGSWQTMVYAKPYLGDTEDNRLDFGAFNELSGRIIDDLIMNLERAAASSDVVILNQQIPTGVSSGEVIRRINRVIAGYPKTRFIVDSRHRASEYHQAILKLNAREALSVLQETVRDGVIPESQAKNAALRITKITGKPVFLTRGEMGMVVADRGDVCVCNGLQIIGRTDPVGAGDTAVAALAGVLGAGGDAVTAARFANIAASVTVRKLQTTGTATPDEIRAAGAEPDEIYQPELAADLSIARYIAGTEIEIAADLPEGLDIRHAIFDHDGTLSTLREGWERIMEPMMLRALLGDRYEALDRATFERIRQQCRIFIDQTTGIQTLAQMQGVVKLVKEYGYVPAEKILDEHGYKAIYNRELLEMIRHRVETLNTGERAPADFEIKNAHAFLNAVKQRGVKLYLASGTDMADVIAEAKAMGYADLFEGRIFGAVGDVKIEAKKVVLERIIREHGLTGSQFATFGDGPVEMRETRRRGGIAIGIASNEARRFGLNPAKRTRLIRSGANVIIPDFGEIDSLLRLLKLE